MRKTRKFGIAILGLLLPCLALLVLLAQPAAVYAQEGSGITSPAPGASINGDVPIYGTATNDPLQKYELHYKLEPSGDDAYIYFAGGTTPVINGQLGVWQAGALPGGTYTIRLRVVRPDGNYSEYYTPNISVNQVAAAPAITTTQTVTETPTPTPTFTPAPQPTAAVGQVTQPQVEGDVPAATPTPAAVAADPAAVDPAAVDPAVVDPNAPATVDIAAGGALLPTATPLGAQAVAGEGNLTDQLGQELGFERLRTQFFNGIRITAALFIGIAALFAGKRLFEWVWKKYG